MSELPLDIQSQILNRADLSIDTRIYFQRNETIQPRRLTEAQKPAELVSKLTHLCEHRVKYYKLKRRLETENTGYSSWFVYITKDIGNNNSCEIFIDEDSRDNNEVKMSIRINHTDHEIEEMWTLRKTVVNMHTGELTGDFYDDSDDDW